MNKPPFRVVFFGTPEFAVPTLEALHSDANFDVVGVVTQPDKPVGRKKVLTAPPVKQFAQENSIPVYQPKSLRVHKTSGEEFLQQLQELHIDCVVLIAYGKIVPQELLDVPPHGFVNLHLSLLPKHRGASPLQQAILDGEPETGVTLMQMDAGMDTGDTLAQESLQIAERETSATLHTRIGQLAAEVATKYIPELLAGNITPQPQDESQVTETGLIKKAHGEIDWSQSAEQIDRHIRAFTPWPGTFTFCGDKRVKILEAHIEDGQLVIDTVQPEGKKAMPYAAFLQGNPDCDFTAGK